MRIDSHQHYWKVERGDYHWMTSAIPLLRRDYLPADLRPSLFRHNIDKTVLVQAAQTVAETDFLLGLAAEVDSIAGVVGWLDMEAADFPVHFEKYRKNPKFIGLRPMLQDIPDDRWILRPRVLSALKVIADADFPFEFLTYSRHLPFVSEVMERIPQLRAVIDHISKPAIRTRTLEPWRTWIAQLAGHGSLYCKLSGMITEADHLRWTADDLHPYIEHVVQCFGLGRVMFGSDWPVCLCAGSYDQVIGVVREVLSSRLNNETESKLFGENARRFYKLDAEASL